MQVQPFMLNGHGTCHGGIIFTLADSAFAFACNSYDRLTVASGADINFVAPAYDGDTLSAFCEEASLSGRTGVYDVRVCNQQHALIAHFRGRSYSLKKPVLGAAREC
jgi:acyl-CoA thioesterase